MAALWRDDGSGWNALAPAGFPDEAALHGLVEDAPQLLPLSGSPRMVVVGREVSLGGGYADLIAVEPSGRLVVIEVKLAKNAEARRAVVAQGLMYAAFLHGLDEKTLEGEVLGRELARRGYGSLASAVSDNDQEGSFDAEEFASGLAESLSTGAFRLVLVLDDAPSELVRLVGYLEAVAGNLVVDLVTVTAYDINGSRVMVPQRVDPERQEMQALGPQPPRSPGYSTPGAADFVAAIDSAPEGRQQDLRRVADWAISLEHQRLARLFTYHGKQNTTLLPYLMDYDAGLVTIWSSATLLAWRGVFEKRAPQSIEPVEIAIGVPLGRGTAIHDPSDDALEALTEAYREAAHGSPRGGLVADKSTTPEAQ